MIRVPNEHARLIIAALLHTCRVIPSAAERTPVLSGVPIDPNCTRPQDRLAIAEFIQHGDDGSGTGIDTTNRAICAVISEIIDGVRAQHVANETDTLDLIESLAEIVSYPGNAALRLTNGVLDALRYELLDQDKRVELTQKLKSGAKCERCHRVFSRGEMLTLVAGGANDSRWVFACQQCQPGQIRACAQPGCEMKINTRTGTPYCATHRHVEEQPATPLPVTPSPAVPEYYDELDNFEPLEAEL